MLHNRTVQGDGSPKAVLQQLRTFGGSQKDSQISANDDASCHKVCDNKKNSQTL